MIRIGDIVRFLNDVGGGRVVEKKGSVVVVEDRDGFQIPVNERECVVIEGAVMAEAEGQPSEKDYGHQVQSRNGDLMEVLLAYSRRESSGNDVNVDVYLVNESNYSLSVQVLFRSQDGKYTCMYSGEKGPYSRDRIFSLDRNSINEFGRKYLVRIMPFKNGKDFDLKPVMEFTPVLDPKNLVRNSSYVENRYLDGPAMIVCLVDEAHGESYGNPEMDPSAMAELIGKNSVPVKKHAARRNMENGDYDSLSSTGIPEYDLHASNILESFSGMENADILKYQLDFFRNVMKKYYGRKHGEKVVFIHGKGDGVLRQSIISVLKREFPKCRYQDASFREYGYGATMVIF